MVTIHYTPGADDGRGGSKGDEFYIEAAPETAESAALIAAFTAIPSTYLRREQDGKLTARANYHEVLALWASGLPWELDAATRALDVLATVIRNITFTEIVQPTTPRFR